MAIVLLVFMGLFSSSADADSQGGSREYYSANGAKLYVESFANIALLLARDHPELVRRLVISGANLRGLPPEKLDRPKLVNLAVDEFLEQPDGKLITP